MNWDKFNQVWADKELSPSEKLLLMAILDHQNGEKAAYPSLRRLSGHMNLATTTISGMTGRLRKDGKLAKKRRQGSSLYIVYPTPEEQAEFGIPNIDIDIPKSEFGIPKSEFGQDETETLTETPTETPIETNNHAAVPQPPNNFQDWIALLRDAPNPGKRIAVLAYAFETLYPQLGEPNYGMIGKTGQRMKSASWLMENLWELAVRPPNVIDCHGLMIYIQGIVKRRKASSPVAPEPTPAEKEAQAEQSSEFKAKRKGRE